MLHLPASLAAELILLLRKLTHIPLDMAVYFIDR